MSPYFFLFFFISISYCTRCNVRSMMINILHNLMDRLRPLVASKAWDYCVLWKLSDDQRFIEWHDCCCGGAFQNGQHVGEEVHHFPVNSALSCRDVMFQHPRTNACDLLALLPCSIPLNSSGIHAQVLLSNQLRWLEFSNALNSTVSEQDSLGTRVLVPVPGGLLELFVTKPVPEDQSLIDFIIAQCSISLEQEALNISSTTMEETNNFTAIDHGYDQEKDTSVMDMNQYRNEMLFEGYVNKPNCAENMSPVIQEMVDPFQTSMLMGEAAEMDDQKEGVKKENGRGDSVSDCSDLNMDDEDEGRYRRGNGKGPQSKNLVAERKRRKKLNDRLYALRALVPKISKLDRASILGDAIEFVRELQNQVKELQDELEEHSDDEGGTKNSCVTSTVVSLDPAAEHMHEKIMNSVYDVNGAASNQNPDTEISTSEKTQQMEPQVEVAQIDGNEFFVKVFCEHKTGGFLRLMEVLDTLGLEVTNANVTSFRGLVSNVLKVEKKDSEMLQTDHVRETLLEVTRKPIMSSRGWAEMMKCPSEPKDGGGDCRHHHHDGGHQHQLNHHFHDHPLITPTHHLHHFHN